MYDPLVYLYIIENTHTLSTNQKIHQILCHHFPNNPWPAASALVSRDVRGKPFLPQFPHIHISVTHSGKWFVCAISPLPVGIDIQKHTLLHKETDTEVCQRYCNISRRFFHPDESDYIAQDPYHRFFRIWTAKESYVKYTGQGIDSMYSHFSVLPNNSKDLQSLGSLLSWQADSVHFLQTDLGEGYTFCMCSAQPASWRWIHLSKDMQHLLP